MISRPNILVMPLNSQFLLISILSQLTMINTEIYPWLFKSVWLFHEDAFLPDPSVDHATLFVVEDTLAVLLAVHPFPPIVFFGGEGESAFAVFAAVLILTFVGRSITPAEFSVAMHFTFLPAAIIPAIIRKHSSTLTLRGEWFLVDESIEGPAVSINNLWFFSWEVFEIDGVWFRLIVLIFEYDLACSGSWVAHDSFEGVAIIVACNLAFSFGFPVSDLTLVLDLLLEKFDYSVAIGYLVEVPIIYIFFRLKHDTFALRISFIAPFSDIVLIQKLMLHQFVIIKQLSETWLF
jgi:hypothetical protein